MKTSWYYFFIFLLFLYSCKKGDDREPVLAGIYDSSLTFHEFSPPFKVNLKLDTLNNFYVGNDSMDINLDGNFDLIIKQRMYLDIKKPNYYTYDTYPYCLLRFKNGLQFSTKIQHYPQGHGQFGTDVGIDTLNYNNRIDNISDWSGTVTNTAMWLDPSSSLVSSSGVWFYLANTEKYIGLRMKINSHYKFGWIKVKQISRENITFISYALEK